MDDSHLEVGPRRLEMTVDPNAQIPAGVTYTCF